MAKRNGNVAEVPTVDVDEQPVAYAHQERQPAPVRPIEQIIDEFWTTINNHPDVKLLSCQLGGRPQKDTEFEGTPISEQHKMEIRFVYRETAEIKVLKKQAKPNPYEPGGKLYHLLPKKEEQTEPQETNGVKPSWAHLVPEGRKAKEPETVEAGA